MEKSFKRNLDKLVENTIQAKKLDEEKQFFGKTHSRDNRRKTLFGALFAGAKWQISLFTSFIGILLLGGVALAAVPELREVIIPTKGKLYVNSVPQGAQVELSGGEYDTYTKVGQTPLEMKLKKGTYNMRLTLEDYEEYERSVDIAIGETASFDIKLKEVMKILDTIKEWKTYSDLENGFEFTYPLKWKVVEDEYSLITVEGENSFFAVYESDMDMQESMDKWEYSEREEIQSENSSNTISIVFYTNNEEELDIYKFIYSTVKVYDLTEDETDSLESYKNTHFSFKYPNEGWLVVEKQKTDYFSEYHVLATEGETKPLIVYYSYGYLAQLDDYSYESDRYINGYRVSEYRSQEKYIYEFPNRVYVSFETSDDSEVNDVFMKILESINLTEDETFQTISDYNNNYAINVPVSWLYTTETNNYEFPGVEYSYFWGANGILKIFQWENVQDEWDNYIQGRESEADFYQTTQVKINGESYTRVSTWVYLWGEGVLRDVYYIKGQFDGNLADADFKMSIGDKEFIMIYVGDLAVLGPEDVSEEVRSELSLIDAIVASTKELE